MLSLLDNKLNKLRLIFIKKNWTKKTAKNTRDLIKYRNLLQSCDL